MQQFRKILNKVGITLRESELTLVSKRYIKHGYTINYVAFISVIENILKWFEEHGFLDCDKNFLEYYPGLIIFADIDSLPRPEVCKVDIALMFGTEKTCHPCVKQQQQKHDCELENIMLRIKKHIFDNRIRTREFFEKFDALKHGFVTKSQFHRSLDAIGRHRMNIAKHDVEKICNAYQDSCDPDRVARSLFCDIIDEVFTIKLVSILVNDSQYRFF